MPLAAGNRRYCAPVRQCQVPGCGREATHGQDWSEPDLAPVEAYLVGIQMRLTVQDIAVILLLCEEHAATLAATAWEPAISQLREWGWTPRRRG